jgi:hypothetical protein
MCLMPCLIIVPCPAADVYGSQKHKSNQVSLVKRTKKNQRKQEHKARMEEKAQLLLGDAQMVDAPGAAAGSKKSRRKGKKQPAKGVSDTAAAAAEVMQE